MTTRPNLGRSEEHTSELQSPCNLVCRLLLEKKKNGGCRGCRSARPTHRWRSRSLPPLTANAFSPPPAPPALSHRRAYPMHFFFFNDTATTEIYPLSLPDALPIYLSVFIGVHPWLILPRLGHGFTPPPPPDRKSARLNSSHGYISYAVFCLEKELVVQGVDALPAFRLRFRVHRRRQFLH